MDIKEVFRVIERYPCADRKLIRPVFILVVVIEALFNATRNSQAYKCKNRR